MKEHGVVSYHVITNEIRNKNIELIGKVVSEDYYVLVVTTNQPYDILKKNYEKHGILHLTGSILLIP